MKYCIGAFGIALRRVCGIHKSCRHAYCIEKRSYIADNVNDMKIFVSKIQRRALYWLHENVYTNQLTL